MALLKRFDQRTGVAVTYWRITAIQADFITAGDGESIGTAVVTMSGYIDKENRDANRAPAARKLIRFTSSQFGGSFDGVSRRLIYMLVKMTPDFSDALDVI